MRSRDERPDGSLPAFAEGDVAERRNPYPLHYKGAFAFSVLLYRSPLSVPYGSLSLSGELRTFHVPLVCLDGLGPCLFAGDGVVSDEGNWIPSYLSRTFWFKPLSIFGLFALTAFIGSSHLLAIPSNPSAPTTLMLVVITSPHGSVTLYRGLHCPESFLPQNCS